MSQPVRKSTNTSLAGGCVKRELNRGLDHYAAVQQELSAHVNPEEAFAARNLTNASLMALLVCVIAIVGLNWIRHRYLKPSDAVDPPTHRLAAPVGRAQSVMAGDRIRPARDIRIHQQLTTWCI